MAKKIILCCEKCGSRNYSYQESIGSKNRLELKKYCSNCKEHTLHKQTK